MSYRIVRNKLKDKTMGLTQSMSVRSMTELLTELFPFTNRACRWQHEPINDVDNIIMNELERITNEVSKKRKVVPGIDGIYSKILVLAHRISPITFLTLYNGCLEQGIFPKKWKVASLVLLENPGKSVTVIPHEI